MSGDARFDSAADAATDSAVLAGEASAAAAVSAPRPAEAPLADLTAAAFFDVDNTMMVGASIFHFARGLAGRKFLHHVRSPSASPCSRSSSGSAAARSPTCREHREHRAVVRRGPSGGRVHRARRGDLRRADGRPDLGGRPGARAGCTWTPDSGCGWSPPRRSSWGRGRGTEEAHRRAGHGRGEAWTASIPVGFGGNTLHGPAKAHAVARARRRRGLDLHSCTAYSDSVNDVPMLPRRGDVAVNPDSSSRHRQGPRLADPRLPHRPQEPPRSACRRCWARGVWRARIRPAWPTAGADACARKVRL